MLNVAICCDDLDQVSVLNSYLVKFSLSHNFKYKLSSFKSFDDLISKSPKHIDILLLNINLTNKQAVFSIYKKIESLYNDIQIIFIPEIVDFMINGFYLKDFKYILKPLKYTSFEEEFSLCLKDSGDTNILMKSIHKSPLSLLGGLSILFIESRGNSCLAYTSNTSVNIDCSIDLLEKTLDSSTFFRCHNDYLINLNKISKLNRTSVIINSKIIPVSECRFNELKNRLLFILKII
jgi:DNA-binding LytR/AlgR family response regulator